MIGVSLAGDATVAQSPEEVQGFLEANKEGLASILFFDPSIPNGDQIASILFFDPSIPNGDQI